MSWRRFVVSAVLVGTVIAPMPAQDETPAPARIDPPAIGPLLGGIRAKYEQPGIAAAVFTSDGIVGSAALGVRERGKEAPIEPGDRFHIGSCTKAMTATIVAMMVEEGKLRWDTTLGDAFPVLRDGIHEKFRAVTLEQLLHHRAGVPPFTAGGAPEFAKIKNLSGTPAEQRLEMTRRILSEAPTSVPGVQFAYSNAGYGIAASAAEVASGQPWEDMLRERLFNPLAMTSAGFGWPATVESPDQPRGHWGDGTPAPMALTAPYKLDTAIAPAGDVHCSAEDFARWGVFHLRGLRGGATRGVSLKAETFQKLHKPEGPQRYAMGWGVSVKSGRTIHQHSGSAGTFFATIAIDAESDIGAVVMTNAANPSANKACAEIIHALLGMPGDDDDE